MNYSPFSQAQGTGKGGAGNLNS